MITNVDRNLLTREEYEKLEKLEAYIAQLGSLAVGFSGGVDSTLLLTVAHNVLKDRAAGITVNTASMPLHEMKEADEYCKMKGIRQIICRFDPMTIEAFRHNDPKRCYHCKLGIFSRIQEIAKENGIAYVAEGSNMDDLGDYRPGLQAVDELHVTSPLRKAGLYKQEIRNISKAMDLPTWNKPAYACLASRFVYGEEITEEKLRMIDRAEQFLIDHGFVEERVRLHGNLARIEVPEKDIPRLASEALRKELFDAFKRIGFMFVTLDMRGYRMGSMNETI